ncbi:hypothetical protein SMC26_24065 [Actinomadura fulvescens]|uniref:Uncharacterized protein n=1 Tax=Actinomadura fulvescens TaxID=46160 RepID=A0ABP6CJM9_9ACTN
MTRAKKLNHPNLTGLLDVAHSSITRTAAALRELTERDGGSLRWGAAQCEALLARDALVRAPSLEADTTPPSERTPATDTDVTADFEETLAEGFRTAATNAERALIKAAEITSNPDDKPACLIAALHCARLRDALR